jgi:glycosyltransferase involved in cell wall biosynthesis
MRILQVIPVFSAPFGGPVTSVRSISKELAKKHELTVYTTTASYGRRNFRNSILEIEREGYRVFFFPRINAFSMFNVSLSMGKALEDNLGEYDIVHLHSWRNFQDIIIHHYARKHGIPYVLQAHGSLSRVDALPRLKWLYDASFGRRLLQDSSKVVALTKKEAQQYKARGVPEKKMALIPNGLNLEEYADLPNRGEFKEKYGIPIDWKIILYLGRIHRIKGIDVLIRSYWELANEMRLDDILLVLAGPDDGYLGKVRELLDRLQLRDKVVLTGPLYGGAKLEAYVDAEFCVLPSRYETFAYTVLEAYGCFKPVIGSNVESIPDIVKHMKTGLIFEAGKTRELAEKMQYLLKHPEECQRMAIAGHNLVREKYSIESVSSLTEALYEEVLQEKSNEIKILRGVGNAPRS